MKLNPLVLMKKEFDQTGSVYDPENNKALVLNETGVLIWEAIQDGLEEADIVKRVFDEFEVDMDTAAQDVSEFLNMLRDKGFLAE